MLTLHRKLNLAALVGLGMLIGAMSTPVRAVGGPGWCENALTANGFATNDIRYQALTPSGLIVSGSALGDLNGIAVEAITLPQTLEY
jgi:hypothetical protein